MRTRTIANPRTSFPRPFQKPRDRFRRAALVDRLGRALGGVRASTPCPEGPRASISLVPPERLSRLSRTFAAGCSFTSTTMIVMLSLPPASRAAESKARAALSGSSGESASISEIPGSDTMPEGAGDEVLLGMLRCLIPGQVAATHELSDERVVLRYGVHVAAAHEVGPRITDVRHLDHGLPLLPTEPDGDHGGSHPRELLVAAAGGHYPPVRFSYGRFERFIRLEIFEHVYGEGARDLPGLEAADAVGDDEERLILT